MPLNWEHRAAVEEDLESELDQEALQKVEERILALRREQDLLDTPTWGALDEFLGAEFQKESNIVFSTMNDMELKLARERARVYARLRKRPKDVESELQELYRERRILRGEEVEPEEE